MASQCLGRHLLQTSDQFDLQSFLLSLHLDLGSYFRLDLFLSIPRTISLAVSVDIAAIKANARMIPCRFLFNKNTIYQLNNSY